MSSRKLKHGAVQSLPTVDGDGPTKMPRKWAGKDLRDAADAALRKRGIPPGSFNWRRNKP